jgi:regulator of nucleoside diphosphate kinase
MVKNAPTLKELVILDTDAKQLKQLLQSRNQYGTALDEEIHKARIVTRPELPADVIIMNSTIGIRDLDTRETYEYQLVYPHEADIDTSKISILAPIGTALLGYRKDDTIQWKVPGGVSRLNITSVTQPPVAS